MKQDPRPKPSQKEKKPNILLRLLALLVTAALVLGALTLVVHRDRFNLDALRRWIAYRNLETGQSGQGEPFSYAGGDSLSLACLDSGPLFVSAAGAHYYAFSGKQYAEEVLALDNPILSASRSSGVVYDAGGQSLFLFRAGEKTFDLSLEGNGDLLSARVNDAGWLAVTAQQSGYKGAVTVYDEDGERVIQISLSSTFAVDAALSPDCKTVAVVTMDQTAGAFSSRVLFYPVDSTQPSASVDLGSITVLDLDYEQGRLWVMGEDRLLILSPDTGESRSYLLERAYLKGCDLGGDGFALLLTGRYRAGSASLALTVAPDGSVLSATELTAPVLDYSSAGDYFSLLTGGQLAIRTYAGSDYAQLADTRGARRTALLPNGSALLADTQQAWFYVPN